MLLDLVSSYHGTDDVGCLTLQNAKVKFQQLQNVMTILGDPEKREVYDQTGSIDAAVSSSH